MNCLIDAVRHRPALRRLCGWETLGEVPSEATFSRAFETFARDNSHLHEEHGGRHVRVRGPVKVAAHLAFGLVVVRSVLATASVWNHTGGT